MSSSESVTIGMWQKLRAMANPVEGNLAAEWPGLLVTG